MQSVEYREQIYDILSDPTVPIATRIDEALEVGVDYLDVSIGFFTRIEDDVQKIVQSTGNHTLIQPGETCPLDDAYCRRTIEIESPLAIQDADASSAVADSAVETFGLGAYIGARILVKNEVYGTICFADTESRETDFTAAESYFVELAARLVAQALEQQSYERELAERETEINTKEEVSRALVDASFDLVFQIGSEGQFTYVSPAVEDLLGYSADDYLGQPFTSMLPDQSTIAVAEEIYESVMAGETVVREYFPLEHRTKEQVLVDIRVTPLYSGEVSPEDRTPADIVGVQGMARDASGRHHRYRLIRVLNRVLRHNLRNDTNVISGYAEMLRDRLEDEDAAYARKIIETTERLITLSETAQKLESNLEAPPEIEIVDIVPLVVQTVNQIDEQYPGASISVHTPDVAMAKSAPRLEAAVWELLDNAANHAGAAPSITVTVRIADEQAVIQVKDDGPGIPADEKAVLLSGQETPLEHGSGLGLLLVHWIVESLGGELTVRDSEAGACVEIALGRTGEPSSE